MMQHRGDSRQRLLAAAVELISAAPGEDVPLRAICDRVGVKLPTLFHFFGNKEGLLQAVTEYGFDLYAAQYQAQEPRKNPLEDLRARWDTHVEFGLANPALYALMYGQAGPGSRPEGQDGPAAALLGLLRAAEAEYRLAVPPVQAAAQFSAACVGVTLRQIVLAAPDRPLSVAVREATIHAITEPPSASDAPDLAGSAVGLLELLPADAAGTDLDDPELHLLRKWLAQLAHRAT